MYECIKETRHHSAKFQRNLNKLQIICLFIFTHSSLFLFMITYPLLFFRCLKMSKTRNFEQASQHIRENLTRHLSKYDNALEGGSDSEESGEEDGLSDKILEELLSSYRTTDKQFLGSARQLLKTALQSTSCLICIESLRKNDRIWTCQTCYASLHLNCVAKWSKVGIL